MQQITSKELVKNKDKSILVVDIRESNSFNDWHIKDSKNIDIYRDIWAGNVENVKEKLIQLPKDKKIVTVCNVGETSRKASMILESLGYDTLVLEKGMMGWNTLHQEADVINENDLFLKQIIRPGKGCLSYLIGSNLSKECFIVDPSLFVDEYLELAKKLSFKIKGIIETHVHADHLSGANSLANLTKTSYYISSKDFNANTEFMDLKNNDEIKIGGVKIKVIESPGHTDGSICLLIDNKSLMTGDTLFLEGVGRPDLGRGNEEIKKGAKLLYSTLNKIKSLNENLVVLPAHFSDYNNIPISEKLNKILDNNKTLSISTEQDFVDYILNNLPNTPPNYEQIKSINKKCMQISLEEAQQLEFGPNRCATK